MKITLVRSAIGKTKNAKRTLRALGLNNIGDKRVVDENNVAHRGMVKKVMHLVRIENEKTAGSPDS